MVPLLVDPFFASMAVSIMAGLGFASILTLLGVPVLYHTYLRKERLQEKAVLKSAKSRERRESGSPGEVLPNSKRRDLSRQFQPVSNAIAAE